MRRVIANGVQWAASDFPRAMPTLLRYDTDDFFNGRGYQGAIATPEGSEEPAGAEARTPEPAGA